MDILFTCQSFALASQEIISAFGCKPPLRIAEDAGIASLEGSIGQIAARFIGDPLPFTRHLLPIAFTLPADAQPEAHAEAIAALMRPGLRYSVQARGFSGNEATRALSAALQQRGFVLDIKKPEQAVSLYRAQRALYVGVSNVRDNLSDWNGGMMHFSARGLIGRAECKLLEAIRMFSIELRGGDAALDLGAAPGGWSHALSEMGLAVTAVDPAELDPRVTVRHVRETAQAFLRRDEGRYHIILNDMKMDAKEALALLYRFRDRLEPGGTILTTLKLPKQGALRVAGDCLASLRDNGTLLGARQLFHNRSEITAWFR